MVIVHQQRIMHGKHYLIWIFPELKASAKTSLFSCLYLFLAAQKIPSLKINY